MTISRPIRIFALVAVIAAVGGVAMLTMKPKKAATPPIVVQAPHVTSTATSTVAKTQSTQATAKTPSGNRTAPPTSRHRETAKKAPSLIAANGLPMTIDAAFRKHRIVVVSIFNPQAPSDAISFAEALAGAKDAGVGFVGISLMDNPLASALTTALPGGGLLPDPGVLIYRRPGVLVQRLDGFADKDVVAQASAASVTAPALTASAASTATATPPTITTP